MSALILLSTDAFSCESNFDEEDIQEVVAIGENTKDEIGIQKVFRILSDFERENKKMNVYVSVFAESWITAVCLYYQPTMTLTLFVMPFFHPCPGVVSMDFLEKQKALFNKYLEKTGRIDAKIVLELDKIKKVLNEPNVCYPVELGFQLYPVIAGFISENEPVIQIKKSLNPLAIYRVVYQNKNKNVPKLQTFKSYIKPIQDQGKAHLQFSSFDGINFPFKTYVHKGLLPKAKKNDGICGPKQSSLWPSKWSPFRSAPATPPATPGPPSARTWRQRMFGFGGRSRKKRSIRKKKKRSNRAHYL